MENTVAFANLMDLISVFGTFCTTSLFFGLSVLNILIITFIFTKVIGILLGGTAPRLVMKNVDNSLHKDSSEKGDK